MLGSTHERIAKEIAKALNFKERETKILQVGSVSPDLWENFPHHEGKNFEIFLSIIEARKLYIQEDDESFHKLGVGLHYIQDKWTLRPRLSDKHTKWEMDIESATILDISQLIDTIKRDLLPIKAEQTYLSFIDKLVAGIPSVSSEEMDATWDFVKAPLINPFLLNCFIHFRQGKGRRLFKPVLEEINKWKSRFWKFGIKVVAYALRERPTPWSFPLLDLNLAYWTCFEVTRNVLSFEHDEGEWFDPELLKRTMVKTLIKAKEREEREADLNLPEENMLNWNWELAVLAHTLCPICNYPLNALNIQSDITENIKLRCPKCRKIISTRTRAPLLDWEREQRARARALAKEEGKKQDKLNAEREKHEY